MKVKNIRVDERLIHGQVATVWTNSLGCGRIIVANDYIVKSEVDISILKMACPAGVKLSLLSVSKAVANINSGKYDGQTFLLIFKTVLDCKRAFDEGLEADAINIGNASIKEGGTKLKNNFGLLPEEIEAVKELLAKGIKITTQMIPNHPQDDIRQFLK